MSLHGNYAKRLFNMGRRSYSQVKLDTVPEIAHKPRKNFWESVGNVAVLNEMVLEGATREAYRAFLERAASTVSTRADDVTSSEVKEAFLVLATTLRESIPPVDSSDEDVSRMIGLLLQRIESTQDTDSDHLKVIKRHLVGELEKLRSENPSFAAASAAPAPAAA